MFTHWKNYYKQQKEMWWSLDTIFSQSEITICHQFKSLLIFKNVFLFTEGPANIPSGLNNRMKALLQKLSKGEITRQCPLIWTIYLQYCAKFEMETKYKDVYFMAVENCPWVKVRITITNNKFSPSEIWSIIKIYEEKT